MIKSRSWFQLLLLVLCHFGVIFDTSGMSGTTLAAPSDFVAELPRTDLADHNLFGVAVGVDDHRVVVGSMTPDFRVAPSSVYLYDFSNAANIVGTRILSPAAQPGVLDNFGASVAISGSRLFVGAPNAGNMGLVYMFDISDPLHLTYRTIAAFDAAPGTAFGQSLAISGNRLVVGSPDHSSLVTLPPAVYLLDVSDPNHIQQSKIVPDPNKNLGRFGDDVDIDGNFLIVGDSDDNTAGSFVGAAYLYDLTNPNQILSKKLLPSDPLVTTAFGRNVSISGKKALVTAVGDVGPVNPPGVSSGTVYLHDFSDWDHTQQIEFAAPDTIGGDSFGGNSDVDLVGNLAIVGAKGQNGSTGSVYLFDVSNPYAIQQLGKIFAPDGQSSDLFGDVLTTDGQSIVVASRRGANVDSNPGRAYLFQVPEPSGIALAAVIPWLWWSGVYRPRTRISTRI
jgi:hypothetical protein